MRDHPESSEQLRQDPRRGVVRDEVLRLDEVTRVGLVGTGIPVKTGTGIVAGQSRKSSEIAWVHFGARGAHTSAHDTDLFDGDDAWVGWTNWGDIDSCTSSQSARRIGAQTTGASALLANEWLWPRPVRGGPSWATLL